MAGLSRRYIKILLFNDHNFEDEFVSATKGYDVWWLVTKIINSTDNPGIPLGNQSSQWFANFYLSIFDHF